MRNLSKRLLAAWLAAMLLLTPNLHVFAEEPVARNLSVFRVDGDEAFLARALHGRGVEPREGQRLSLGNVMQTGLDTQVYMQLDTASIVKQDELTYVAVSAAGNLLSLSVLRGSALVEVQEMEPGQRLETRIGSTVMSVRGTIFTASIRDNGATVITMLSGEGVVFVPDETGVLEERPLVAGYVFWAHDDGAIDAFDFRPIDPQAMSLFELREVHYRSDYLLRIGTITPAMHAQLPGLINSRQTERDNRHQAQQTAFTDFRAEPTQVIEFQPPQRVAGPDYVMIGGQWFSTRLTELSLTNLALTNEDILQIRYMTNLVSLDLAWNRISDISPLRGLTGLTELRLSWNEISDIRPLAGLTRLTTLSLSWNEINDLTPLVGLTRLTTLHLGGNEISDISPLRGLTGLTELSLFWNEISDISPLVGLTSISIPN